MRRRQRRPKPGAQVIIGSILSVIWFFFSLLYLHLCIHVLRTLLPSSALPHFNLIPGTWRRKLPMKDREEEGIRINTDVHKLSQINIHSFVLSFVTNYRQAVDNSKLL